MAKKTKKRPGRNASTSLKTILPKGDGIRLRDHLIAKKWNSTKGGVFIGVSPSVIDSAIAGRTIRKVSAETILEYLKREG